ncbi:GNAT family N-acetyltransferase [Histidinibacterium aquaticum]|uniref:GNAT family N-acetyltransferase n=1 Tax=Histidinibacterium aquaticum TaxID=2613962 RepID=A0A5J5GR37_9RHOB|nr:GNAT family N-acetyltransferase [Histidinibacterium aquaticum]KAA9010555.1 GNAT family N-acetyltransferase [Histidinibacterium aquaticum]
MIVRRGFGPDDRPRLAELYWGAFGPKLGRVLGPERRALDFIAISASPQHALCVFDDSDALVGVAGFQSAFGSLVAGDYQDLVAVYGPLGAAWRALALRMLERPAARDELMVDGIFVDPAWRGRGIGTALIEALAREAVTLGRSSLRLEVAAGNDRARALYEERGFVAVSRRIRPALSLLCGLGRTTMMVRKLTR